jgi:hypothetical protein
MKPSEPSGGRKMNETLTIESSLLDPTTRKVAIEYDEEYLIFRALDYLTLINSVRTHHDFNSPKEHDKNITSALDFLGYHVEDLLRAYTNIVEFPAKLEKQEVTQ